MLRTHSYTIMLNAVDRATRVVNAMAGNAQSKLAALSRSANDRGRNLQAAGRDMAVAGVAAGYGILKVTEAAAKFEEQMNYTGAILKATPADMAKLEAQAKKLASTTTFAATEVGQAQLLLGKAGISTNKILQSTPAVLDLARVGQMDLAAAADIASSALSAFGYQNLTAAQMNNMMMSAANSSNMELGDMAYTLKYTAAAAKGLDVPFQNIVGMTGILAKNMIRGEMAGTGLRTAFNKLYAPTNTAQEAMASMGITLEKWRGMSAFDRLADLGTQMAKLGQSERLMAARQIFETEGMNAGLILTSAAARGELQRYTATLNRAGAMQQASNRINSGAAARYQMMKNSINLAAIEIGNALLPVLVPLAQKLAEIAKQFGAWVQRNPKLAAGIAKAAVYTTGFVVGVGALSTVLGTVWKVVAGVAWVTGKLGAAFGFATRAGVFLGNAFSFIWRVIKGVGIVLRVIGAASLGVAAAWGLVAAAVGVVAKKIYDNWDSIKQFFSKIGKALYYAGAKFATMFADGIKAGWRKVKSAVHSAVQAVRDYFPSSPAKVGPLSDIHKLKFMETVALSIRPAPLVNATNRALDTAFNGQQRPQRAAPSSGAFNINYAPTINAVGGTEGIQSQLDQHKNDLEAMLRKLMLNKARLAY